jgi:creatinine amidohydrolase
MRIADMNWMQVEAYLERDDRAVLPIGSTEQHAYLSLATDALLAERIAVEAAAPLGVPVFPVMPYGITPNFTAYPGTLTLAPTTFVQVLRELLDGMAGAGFRRVLVVNGHGGNTAAAQPACNEWAAARPECRVRVHSWWNAPRTIEKVEAFDPVASHASWMESFPWTRIAGAPTPDRSKPMIDWKRLPTLDPRGVRDLIGDGNFGGLYQRPDDEMHAIWEVAVEETRERLEGDWD